MEFLEAQNIEWQAIWPELANNPINKGDPLCLNKGACWEYMGSCYDYHHLRHIYHPMTKKPEYIYIERRIKSAAWA